MMKCSECGKDVEFGVYKCPHCGNILMSEDTSVQKKSLLPVVIVGAIILIAAIGIVTFAQKKHTIEIPVKITIEGEIKTN